MKRIGILGGTFNPVHIGHLAIAQTVLDEFKLDKVIFVPSNLPPHKRKKNVISARERYQMLCLAVKGNPCFDISDFEIKRKGKSYSIHTVNYFLEQFSKKTKFFFIIGSDMLAGLTSWKKFEELNRKVNFVAVNRKGFEKVKSKTKVKKIDTLDLGISSSYIRRCLRNGKTVKYLLPESVSNYIDKRKLYTT